MTASVPGSTIVRRPSSQLRSVESVANGIAADNQETRDYQLYPIHTPMRLATERPRACACHQRAIPSRGVRGLPLMTITTLDLNRMFWEAGVRGEQPEWGTLATEPDGMHQEWVDIPAGLWLRPPDPLAGPVVMAVHGGGFVSGSVVTHHRMFGHLACASGMSTFAVEYGLVPEHVFPSQLRTVITAYQWLINRGATRVAVIGDSCGATLALGLALLARDTGLEPPASLLLMSAWTDLEATGASYDTGSDPFFNRELVQALGAGYLGGADPHDPLAAPLYADLHGLPATYLQVGAEESLLDDSRSLADRMQDADVDVRLDEFAGQLHTFQMAAGRTDIANGAIERAGSWLRSTLIS
jgi:monoterpene epsilon-lactone hydrolase